MKFIELPNEQKRRLGRMFRVSSVTVWAALTYQTHSPLADRIREEARRAGGVEKRRLSVPADFLPNCETEYRRDGDRIVELVQSFASGVRVTFDCDDASAELQRNGRCVRRYEAVTTDRWAAILWEAQQLAEQLG